MAEKPLSLSLSLSLTPRDFKCSHKEIAFGKSLPMNSVRSVRRRGEKGKGREEGERRLGNEITRVASNNRENVARMQMQRRSKFLPSTQNKSVPLWRSYPRFNRDRLFYDAMLNYFQSDFIVTIFLIIFLLRRYLSIDIACF